MIAAASGNDLATIIPATIGAIGSAMALIITALNRRTATTTESKVDTHGSEISEIKNNVNGALSSQISRADVAEARVAGLREAAGLPKVPPPNGT
jgi:hypothetical protein